MCVKPDSYCILMRLPGQYRIREKDKQPEPGMSNIQFRLIYQFLAKTAQLQDRADRTSNISPTT
jgi:hypothetical protein